MDKLFKGRFKNEGKWLWDPISGKVEVFNNQRMAWVKLNGIFRPNCKEEMAEEKKKVKKAVEDYLKKRI